MGKFSKHLLNPGTYSPASGEIRIPRKRMRHWIDQFRRMKKARLRIPVPWGHVNSTPRDPDEKEFWASKYNAGFVEDLSMDDRGRLMATLEIPLEDDQKQIGKTVREVSPEIRSSFVDGEGREWNDVITHVALCTLPVAAGQDNFEAALDAKGGDGASVMHLSLSQIVKKTEESKMAKGKKVERMQVEDVEREPEELAELPEREAEEPEGKVATLCDLLEEEGLVLGEDTDIDNLVDRLIVAVKTKKEVEGEAPDEVPEEVVEEEEPEELLLSHQLKANPLMQNLYQRLESSDRERMIARVGRLLSTGRITPAIAKKLKAEAAAHRMSLDVKTGKSQPSRLDYLLDFAEQLPGGACWEPGEKLRQMNLEEAAVAPEARYGTDDDLSVAEVDEQAERLLNRVGRGNNQNKK